MKYLVLPVCLIALAAFAAPVMAGAPVVRSRPVVVGGYHNRGAFTGHYGHNRAIIARPYYAPSYHAAPVYAAPYYAQPIYQAPLYTAPIVVAPVQQYVQPVQQYVAPVQTYVQPVQSYVAPVQQYCAPQVGCYAQPFIGGYSGYNQFRSHQRQAVIIRRR